MNRNIVAVIMALVLVVVASVASAYSIAEYEMTNTGQPALHFIPFQQVTPTIGISAFFSVAEGWSQGYGKLDYTPWASDSLHWQLDASAGYGFESGYRHPKFGSSVIVTKGAYLLVAIDEEGASHWHKAYGTYTTGILGVGGMTIYLEGVGPMAQITFPLGTALKGSVWASMLMQSGTRPTLHLAQQLSW